MSANRPIPTPDDMLGLKIRIQSSKILEAQMQALDAVPQVLPFSEVYQALQTGVVDGTENPPSNMYAEKIDEVQKYATLTRHGYLGYAVVTNAALWNGLPGELRAAIERAMAAATPFANAIAEEDDALALDRMRKPGRTRFHEPSEEERSAWRKQLLPVQDSMAARIGETWIERARTTLGKR